MALFTNQAKLSYDATTLHSNLAVGEVRSALSIRKTALSGDYRVGGTAVYLVTVANEGENSFSDLTLTDSLGAYAFGQGTLYPLTYQTDSAMLWENGVLQSAPTVSAVRPLTVTGLTVPAGGTLQLVYRATVNSYAPPASGGRIRNTVSLTGASLAQTLSASETIASAFVPALAIAKSILPVPVLENGRLTYTFVLLNTGFADADAGERVAVNDLFSPILHDVTVTLDGEPLSAPSQYTYNEATGLFQTVPGQITVPAATAVQDTRTGEWSVTPGSVTLQVSGRL